MRPKEKAKELYRQFAEKSNCFYCGKQCAIHHIQSMIDTLEPLGIENIKFGVIEYYKNVLTELKTL